MTRQALTSSGSFVKQPSGVDGQNPFAPPSAELASSGTRRSLSGMVLLQSWLFAGLIGTLSIVLVVGAVWRYFLPFLAPALWNTKFVTTALTVTGIFGLAIGYTLGYRKSRELDWRIQELDQHRRQLIDQMQDRFVQGDHENERPHERPAENARGE